MNREQQRILSEKIKKDQAFVQLIAQESSHKRSLRSTAIEMAFRVAQMTAQTRVDATSEQLTASILKDAEDFFKFITSDGGLDTLESSNIQTL